MQLQVVRCWLHCIDDRPDDDVQRVAQEQKHSDGKLLLVEEELVPHDCESWKEVNQKEEAGKDELFILGKVSNDRDVISLVDDCKDKPPADHQKGVLIG